MPSRSRLVEAAVTVAVARDQHHVSRRLLVLRDVTLLALTAGHLLARRRPAFSIQPEPAATRQDAPEDEDP